MDQNLWSPGGFNFDPHPYMERDTKSSRILWWTSFRWEFMSTNHFAGGSPSEFMAIEETKQPGKMVVWDVLHFILLRTEKEPPFEEPCGVPPPHFCFGKTATIEQNNGWANWGSFFFSFLFSWGGGVFIRLQAWIC